MLIYLPDANNMNNFITKLCAFTEDGSFQTKVNRMQNLPEKSPKTCSSSPVKIIILLSICTASTLDTLALDTLALNTL